MFMAGTACDGKVDQDITNDCFEYVKSGELTDEDYAVLERKLNRGDSMDYIEICLIQACTSRELGAITECRWSHPWSQDGAICFESNF